MAARVGRSLIQADSSNAEVIVQMTSHDLNDFPERSITYNIHARPTTEVDANRGECYQDV